MAYRSSTSTRITEGSGATLTGSLPSGTAAGDRLLALVTQDVAGHTINAATGWSTSALATLDNSGPDGQSVRVFEKKNATGSDAVNFTSSGTKRAIVQIVAFSGRSNTAPATVSTPTVDTSNNSTPITVSLTGLTAVTSDDLVWFAQLDQAGNTDTWGFSSPSGFTEAQDDSNGNWITATTQIQDNVSAGATGSLSATATRASGASGAGWSGVVIALPVYSAPVFDGTMKLGENTGDDYTGGLSVVELYSAQPTTNQGTGASTLSMTSWTDGDYSHALLRWNDAPVIGDPVYVVAADLEWHIYAASGAQPFIFYKCLRAADPSTATWNTYDGSNSWGTAGALNATDIDIANGITVAGWAAGTSKNITAEWFRQLVQDFLNGVVSEIVIVGMRKPYNAGNGGANFSANLYQPSGSTTLGPRINITYIQVPDSASPSSDVTTTGWSSTGGSFYTEVDESTVNTADYLTSPDITDDSGSSPLVLGLSGTTDNGDVLVQISSKCVSTEAWQRVLLLDSGGTAQATGNWFAPPIGDYTHDIVLAPAADVVRVKVENRLSRPVPAYYTALTSAEWSPLPDSTFQNSPAWWTQSTLGSDVGGGDQSAIYTKWNSFVINTVGCYYDSRFHWGTFIMFVGAGGHGDWYGTGVVAYGPLDNYSEAPKWHTLIDHIVPGPTGSARSGSTPTSHHIYQSQHFDAATNRVIGITTPGYSSAGASSNASNALDCYTNTWSALADASNVGSEAGVNAVSCNDGTYIWMLPTGNGYSLNRVTLSNDARSTYTKDFPETRAGLAAGLHPTASVMAWSDGTTVWAFDLRDPTTNVRYTPTVTGTAPGSTNGLSLSWNTTNSRFECRTSASNKTVYHLTPGADPYSGGDDWAWSSTTPGSGTTPVAEATGSGGQYGKAQWLNGVVPGMVYAPDPTAPIYIYKP